MPDSYRWMASCYDQEWFGLIAIVCGVGRMVKRLEIDMAENDHLKARFSRVYATNLWLDDESISGPGSRKDSPPVVAAVSALSYVFERYQISSMADVPCGDLNWIAPFMQQNRAVAYKGYDIVPPLVENNQRQHPGIHCEVRDAVHEVLPYADLIFSKDLLIHLNFQDINSLMHNFALSGSRYIMVTNNFGLGNSDLMEEIHGDSACRYVDLMDAPFRYPDPLWRTDFFGLWSSKDLLTFFEDLETPR